MTNNDVCKPDADRYPTAKENFLNAAKEVVGVGWALKGMANTACDKANKDHQAKKAKDATNDSDPRKAN